MKIYKSLQTEMRKSPGYRYAEKKLKSDIPFQFGMVVTGFRIKYGLTQTKLARKLKVKVSEIKRWEAN